MSWPARWSWLWRLLVVLPTLTAANVVSLTLTSSFPSAHACSTVSFFSSTNFNSTNTKPPLYAWYFGSQTPMAMRTAALRKTLQAASLLNQPTLTIPAVVVSAAVNAVMSMNITKPSYNLQVVLIMGGPSFAKFVQASATVELLADPGYAPPIIVAEGFSEVVLGRLDVGSLMVSTSEAPFAPNCTGAGRAAGTVQVVWLYQRMGDKTWATIAPDMSGDAPLLVSSRQPNIASFDASRVSPGSLHLVRALAMRPGALPLLETLEQQTNFKVSVSPASPPVVVATAPAKGAVSGSCSFTLDASPSFDPASTDTRPVSLIYNWSCVSVVPVGSPDQCPSVSNFQPSKLAISDGTGASGPKLVVNSAQMLSGTYLFVASVRRADKQDSPGVLRVPITLNKRDPPVTPLVVAVPSYLRSGRFSTYFGAPGAVAIITADKANSCEVPSDVIWHWVLVDTSFPATIVAMMGTFTDEQAGGLSISTAGNSSVVLVPGNTYVPTLLQAADAEAFLELERALPADLSTSTLGNSSNYTVAGQALSFIADGPPAGGATIVSPLMGQSLRTTFTLLAAGWSDEDVLSLNYAFYGFDNSSLVASSGLNSSASLDDLVATVEWIDPRSPNYWANIGGVLLQDASPSPQAQGITLPPGTFVIVAMATDIMQVASVAVAPAPLVVLRAANLTSFEIQNALALAAASNQANRIFDTVSMAAQSLRGQLNATTVDKASDLLLTTMLSSASLLSPTDASLRKLGDAVDSVLILNDPQVIQGPISLKVLNSSLNVLLTGLATMLQSDGAEGASASTGTSLYSVLGHVTNAASASGTADKALQSQVLGLPSQLGRAMALAISPGEVVSLADPGFPVSIALLKGSVSNQEYKLNDLTIKVNGSSLLAATKRQLQGLSSCGSLTFQVTAWSGTFLQAWQGSSSFDAAVAAAVPAVKVLEMRACEKLITKTGLSPPLSLSLPIKSPGPPGPGMQLIGRCLRYDTDIATNPASINGSYWTTAGVQMVPDPSLNSSTSAVCMSSWTSGVFTAYLSLEPVPTQPPSTTPPPSQQGISLVPIIIGICAALLIGSAAGLAYYWWRRKKLSRVDVEEGVLDLACTEEEIKKEEFALQLAQPQNRRLLPTDLESPQRSRLRAAGLENVTVNELLQQIQNVGFREDLVHGVDTILAIQRSEEHRTRAARLEAATEPPALSSGPRRGRRR